MLMSQLQNDFLFYPKLYQRLCYKYSYLWQ